jgi:hypothetical protein
MPVNPTFFVPNARPGKDEELYASIAKDCGREIAPKDARIYRIWFIHNSERWTATVGEPLSGTSVHISGLGRNKVERSTPVYDPAVVMAIFAEAPYLVFTDADFSNRERSRWVNPFMAGIPTGVEYFSVSPS